MIQTFIEAHVAYKFFQKLFGNAKRSTYRYTEDVVEKYRSLIEYKYIHNNSKRLNQIGTNTSIKLMNGLNLGDSIDQVRKKFRISPYVKVFKSRGIRRTILLYKFKVNGQKVKLETHFYKNELFFSKCIFSDLSLNKAAKKELSNHFGNKYGVNKLDFIQKNIVDSSNQSVKLNTQGEVAISYVNLNSLFFERMQEKMAVKANEVEINYGDLLRA